MIGMLLPFVWILAWCIENEKFPSEIIHLVWIMECATLMLLVYTFSRWAILAGICSAVTFGWIGERRQDGSGRLGEPSLPLAGWWDVVRGMKNTWLRVAVLGIALIATGAWGRFLIAAQGDKSILNRVTLWTGGLKMIADRPFSGWGDGSAGVNYDNWYQDLSSQTLHGGMTNSYLNIAVEGGLPMLGVILFGLFLCIFLCHYLASSMSPARKGLLAGAAAIIVYFALANVGYSTIYYILPLVVLAVAVLILVVFCINKVTQTLLSVPKTSQLNSTDKVRASTTVRHVCAIFRKPFLFATIASVVCVFSLYLGGVYALRNESIRVNRVATGNVLLHKAGVSAKTINLTLAPDYRILGANYGRPIRNTLAQDVDYSGVVQVLEPEADFISCAGENVLVLGARIRDWGTRVAKDGQRIVFVCPTSPPNGQPKVRQLFLPQNDIWHVTAAWKEWAEKNGCPITFLEGNGFLDEGNMKIVWNFIKTI